MERSSGEPRQDRDTLPTTLRSFFPAPFLRYMKGTRTSLRPSPPPFSYYDLRLGQALSIFHDPSLAASRDWFGKSVTSPKHHLKGHRPEDSEEQEHLVLRKCLMEEIPIPRLGGV